MIERYAGYALVFCLILGGFLGYRHYQQEIGDKAVQEAQILKGQVDALKNEAQTHKATADQFATQAAAQEEQVKALKAKLASLAHKPSVVGQPADGGQVDSGVPAAGEADNLKDQIIDAQDKQIVSLKGENLELRASLDVVNKALDASERRASGLEVALDAVKKAQKASKWLYRGEGFLIGIGAGYVAGRFQ